MDAAPPPEVTWQSCLPYPGTKDLVSFLSARGLPLKARRLELRRSETWEDHEDGFFLEVQSLIPDRLPLEGGAPAGAV